MSEDHRDRIESLLKKGRLRKADADAILGALEELDERRATAAPAKTPRVRRGWALLAARFLEGEIGETELLAGTRRMSVKLGAAFGALMLVVHLVVLVPLTSFVVPEASPWLMLAVGLPLGLIGWTIGGAAFGAAMHFLVFLPRARRLARMRAAVDRPMEPIEGARAGQCPTCGAESSKLTTSRHPLMLHFIWNPGLLVNDLAFGQRIPAEYRDCDECGSRFVDCAACELAIDCNTWPEKHFGNWSGLCCPHCDVEVPSARNQWAKWLEAPFVRGRRNGNSATA